MVVLDDIKKCGDIKKVPANLYHTLAQEIREFLVESVSKSGGHLSSNLGTVELTMALHIAFDPEYDKIIWDVGHQCYTHKLLSGRKEDFDDFRSFHGMSGFPKRIESVCDPYETGHSSTSVSAGLGFVSARDLLGEDYSVISVIGDGAMTGGLAYEALNNASRIKGNFIIVLNDNEMSISKNVGGMSAHLASLRTSEKYLTLKEDVTKRISSIPKYGERMVERISRTKSGLKQLMIPGMIFENLGIKYLGPFDGHDVQSMVKVFKEAKNIEGAVVVHVVTKKGYGYFPARRHPERFHGTPPFDIETGAPKKKKDKPSYTDVFSATITKLGESDEKLVGITAAMEDGVGLKRFHAAYPERFFRIRLCAGSCGLFVIPSERLRRAGTRRLSAKAADGALRGSRGYCRGGR